MCWFCVVGMRTTKDLYRGLAELGGVAWYCRGGPLRETRLPLSGLGDARRQIGHHRRVHPTLVRLADILSHDLDRNMANAGCPHGCPAQHLPQSGAGAADHRHNQNSPWPDVFRPPTSSKKAVWTAVKAWMTGTSPVKGTWSCSWVSANNRLLSAGQPWDVRENASRSTSAVHLAVRSEPSRRSRFVRSGASFPRRLTCRTRLPLPEESLSRARS
jgi:hypothetical protein